MRQILCVIDFTESSGKVLEVAARIAKACNAHLIVLFPFRLIQNSHPGDLPSLKRKLETEARERFHKLQESIPNGDDLPMEFLSEIGFMADRIESHVKRNSPDMVIIGQPQTLAANDIKSFNLQNLIANSKIPFVIVPAEIKAEASV